jgi:hypothetical protein
LLAKKLRSAESIPAHIEFIAPRVLKLVYTTNNLHPFAEDMGYHGESFRWGEVRRALLRAELDSYYIRLYVLTRDELCYILDPKEVHCEDFPNSTCPLAEREESPLVWGIIRHAVSRAITS